MWARTPVARRGVVTEAWTLDKISAANKKAGRYFFHPDGIKLWRSKFEPPVYDGPGGVFFVESQIIDPGRGRCWKVRKFDPGTGSVLYAEDCPSSLAAHNAAKWLSFNGDSTQSRFNLDDTSESRGAKKSRGDVICAAIYSDDRRVAAEFDALPFFEGASDTEIIKLAKGEWCQCETADDVARKVERHNAGVRVVFQYLQRHDVGYEVFVDAADAIAWLVENNYGVLQKIRDAGVDLSDYDVPSPQLHLDLGESRSEELPSWCVEGAELVFVDSSEYGSYAACTDAMKPMASHNRHEESLGRHYVVQDSAIKSLEVTNIDGSWVRLAFKVEGELWVTWLRGPAVAQCLRPVRPHQQHLDLQESLGFQIPAKAWTSNHYSEAEFDAVEWFRQASDDDIRFLMSDGFNDGDYVQDIADYCMDKFPDLVDVFYFGSRDAHFGVFVEIDATAVARWLANTNPHLFLEVWDDLDKAGAGMVLKQAHLDLEESTNGITPGMQLKPKAVIPEPYTTQLACYQVNPWTTPRPLLNNFGFRWYPAELIKSVEVVDVKDGVARLAVEVSGCGEMAAELTVECARGTMEPLNPASSPQLQLDLEEGRRKTHPSNKDRAVEVRVSCVPFSEEDLPGVDPKDIKANIQSWLENYGLKIRFEGNDDPNFTVVVTGPQDWYNSDDCRAPYPDVLAWEIQSMLEDNGLMVSVNANWKPQQMHLDLKELTRRDLPSWVAPGVNVELQHTAKTIALWGLETRCKNYQGKKCRVSDMDIRDIEVLSVGLSVITVKFMAGEDRYTANWVHEFVADVVRPKSPRQTHLNLEEAGNDYPFVAGDTATYKDGAKRFNLRVYSMKNLEAIKACDRKGPAPFHRVRRRDLEHRDDLKFVVLHVGRQMVVAQLKTPEGPKIVRFTRLHFVNRFKKTGSPQLQLDLDLSESRRQARLFDRQYDLWFDHYKPLQNHITADAPFDGTLFETYGDESLYCFDYNRNHYGHVWTLMEFNDEMFITPGYHCVDRLGYFITERPWRDENNVVGEPQFEPELDLQQMQLGLDERLREPQYRPQVGDELVWREVNGVRYPWGGRTGYTRDSDVTLANYQRKRKHQVADSKIGHLVVVEVAKDAATVLLRFDLNGLQCFTVWCIEAVTEFLRPSTPQQTHLNLEESLCEGSVVAKIAELTGTQCDDWLVDDGPSSGVGVDYWFVHKNPLPDGESRTVWANRDQDYWLIASDGEDIKWEGWDNELPEAPPDPPQQLQLGLSEDP